MGNSKNITKNRHAFTLIELLVVISIIALLLSILMPSLQKVKEQARKVVCGSNLKQLAIVAHTYAGDNNGKFPVRERLWSPNYYGIVNQLATAGGTPNASNVAWDGRYIFDGYLPGFILVERGVANIGVDKGDKVMWCPSSVGTSMGYGDYEDGRGTWPDLRTDGFAGYFTSYQYAVCGKEGENYAAGGNSIPIPGIEMPRTTEDRGNIPLFGDTMTGLVSDVPTWRLVSHMKNGRAVENYYESGKPAGINNAYVDGSVSWTQYNDMKPFFMYMNDPSYVEFWGGKGIANGVTPP